MRACSSGNCRRSGVLKPCAEFGIWGGKKMMSCNRCRKSTRESKERTVLAPVRARTASAAERGTLLLDRIRIRTAHIWVALAWLLQGTLLAWGLLGEPPHFGFAPALSVTAWLVAAVYAVESLIYPQLPTR